MENIVMFSAEWWTLPLGTSWMAWTRATAGFFIFIVLAISSMGVWEYYSPGGAPRRGVLACLYHTPPHAKTRAAPPPLPTGLRNARAPTSTRSIGFCVIWVCISSSSSSVCSQISQKLGTEPFAAQRVCFGAPHDNQAVLLPHKDDEASAGTGA